MSLMAEIQQKKSKIFPLMERVLFLKNVEMFKNIDTEKLMVIAGIAKDVAFSRGELVSRQNDVGDALYIVRQGSLRVIREKGEQRTVLSILGPGDCFGAWGLFGNHPRSATAEANEDTRLLMIRRAEFKEVLYEYPEITYNLLEIFSELLRKANSEISVLNHMLSDKHRKPLS